MLQRIVEFAKHPERLNIAATIKDPFERHVYVASYATTFFGWF